LPARHLQKKIKINKTPAQKTKKQPAGFQDLPEKSPKPNQ